MIADDSTRLTLSVAPASEPLTLTEAKQFLRIEHNADDAMITQAILAARQAAEQYLRVVLLPQTHLFETAQIGHVISLPVGPAQSITSIVAYNEAGTPTTLNSNFYRLTLDGYGVVFTTVPQAARLAITFVSGLATSSSDVPHTIRQGMLHHIAAMLEQREGLSGLPLQTLQCYQPHRRVRL